MLDWLVGLQTVIHGIVSEDIASFVASGDLATLLSLLPLAVGLGAIHALTPGHNKLVLATYLVGERPPMVRALGMSALLSLIHIASAVVIALGASWLVSRTITSAGQAPVLQISSRILLVAIGAWMVLRALRHRSHVHGEGAVFAVAAGLIPCPLTLFIMFYAVSQGVPQAGLVFAVAMLIGVGGVLCLVGIASTLAAGFLSQNAAAWASGPRFIGGIAGVAMIAIGAAQLLS